MKTYKFRPIADNPISIIYYGIDVDLHVYKMMFYKKNQSIR